MAILNYRNRDEHRSNPSVLFTVASKQKSKKGNTEYHGTFTPLKNQLYSKPGSPIFLLMGHGA